MKKTQTTIKDIANELGISFSTVSRALHNHPRIGLRTREQVQAKAKELDYIPNPVANFLKSNQTYSIGIIVPNLHEEFFVDTIEGIENILEPKGYHAVIIQSKESLEKEKKAVETLLKLRVDGILVSMSKETDSVEHFSNLEKYGIPVVYFDRVPNTDQAHKVKCNTKPGAIAAVEHLHKLGIKNIGFMNGPEQLETAQERLEGYKAGLEQCGINYDESLVINTNLDELSTKKSFDILLKNNPDLEALLCFNDIITFTAMQAYNVKMNNNFPILFAGFGNLAFISYLERKPAFSIEQHPLQMGMSAAKLLLECIENDDEKIPFQLITLSSNLVIFN